jgi:hypothetical protein
MIKSTMGWSLLVPPVGGESLLLSEVAMVLLTALSKLRFTRL